MLEQIKLITSRRAYEFRTDSLRLSTLSIKPIQEQIMHIFQFQTSVMAQPMATFGDVPASYPPGFVFNMGVWISPETQVIPIRFLHFEQNRIVIDVAGPSSAITEIFEQLKHFLSGLQTPDGSQVVGEPERILDYTIISAQFSFALGALFSPTLRNLFSKIRDTEASTQELALTSTIVIQNSPSKQAAKTASPEESNAFTFGLRAGTRPEEHIYFSCAPLNSESHLQYLYELEEALSS